MSSRDILQRPAPAADQRLIYGPEASNFIDFRYPVGNPRGLVMMIHGGFWRERFDLLYAGHACDALAAAGFTTANVEYRRVGQTGGGYPGTLEDIAAAYAFVREQYSERVCVVGHSAGGHLALWLAAQSPSMVGAVGLGAVACLRKAWELNLSGGAVQDFIGSPHDYPERYAFACPAERSSAVPRVLIHGSSDDIVPPSVAYEFMRLRAADPGGVTICELPGVDHHQVMDPLSSAWPAVLEAAESFVS